MHRDAGPLLAVEGARQAVEGARLVQEISEESIYQKNEFGFIR